MSTMAVGRPGLHVLRFWETTLGKKAIMAVTGVALFGFVVGHLLGNLQVYLGAERLNAYGNLLHHSPGLLWGARLGLLVCVGLHIWASVQLALRKNAARPVSYARWKPTVSTYASRTMYWSGPIILAFVIYHILHFTTGAAHNNFIPGDVYHNVVAGFSVWYVSAFYIFAMALLCLHLYHGLWSMFQTLGASHPKYSERLRLAARVFALLIFLGNISIPISVLAGLVPEQGNEVHATRR